MNYSMQGAGLIINGKNGWLDYSRFVLPVLDETALSETTGLGVSATAYPGTNGYPSADQYGTWFYCLGDDASKVVPQRTNSLSGNVNWDCDAKNIISTNPVKTDINADGFANITINGVNTGLTTFNDWAALVYSGGSLGGNGAGIAKPATTTSIEIPEEQENLVNAPFGVAISGMGRVRTAPNSRITLRFVVKNIGQTDDTYKLTSVMQLVPSHHSGDAGPRSTGYLARTGRKNSRQRGAAQRTGTAPPAHPPAVARMARR